jgi:hypothetical protein
MYGLRHSLGLLDSLSQLFTALGRLEIYIISTQLLSQEPFGGSTIEDLLFHLDTMVEIWMSDGI